MKRAHLKRDPWKHPKGCVLSYVVSLLVILILVGGFLHTKAGRPLLARLGVGCPMQASPEDVEAARLTSARAQRGAEAAASRPALGFALDRTSLSDVKAWAEHAHVSCESVRVGLLRCTDVPVAALAGKGPPIDRLDLGFSLASEKLVNISAWRSELSSTVAAAQLNAVASSMKQQLGAPTREAGSRSASYLAAGPLHTAVVSYRFQDYIADLSATNIPGHGLSLREHYLSARD